MKLHNANMSPPQECKWNLSVDDLKNKYETSIRKKLMSEEKTDRGKRRLKVTLESFKRHGVLGRNKTQTKVKFSFTSIDSNDTLKIFTYY